MGRARWKIENETFNTLKNQGYHFEHNFGHGKKNLSNNMGTFMFLAFLIDQIQQLCCPIYKAIIKSSKVKKYVYDKIRSFFTNKVLKSFDDLYESVLYLWYENRKKYTLEFCESNSS